MSAARQHSWETQEGNLALDRMDQRAKRWEQEYQDAPQPETRVLPKPRKINLGNVFLLVFVCFVAVFGVLYMQTRIQSNNLRVAALRSELKTERKTTEALKLEIVMSEDLTKVRSIAEREGLNAPGQGQVVYVKLPDDAPIGTQGANVQ